MLQSEVCNGYRTVVGVLRVWGGRLNGGAGARGPTVGRAQTYYRNPNTPQPHRSKVHATGQVGRAAV